MGSAYEACQLGPGKREPHCGRTTGWVKGACHGADLLVTIPNATSKATAARLAWPSRTKVIEAMVSSGTGGILMSIS